MKDIHLINWDFNHGYVPDKYTYCNPLYDRNNFIKRYPRGFMNLPNADLIIDRMMFYARLNHIFTNHLARNL